MIRSKQLSYDSRWRRIVPTPIVYYKIPVSGKLFSLTGKHLYRDYKNASCMCNDLYILTYFWAAVSRLRLTCQCIYNQCFVLCSSRFIALKVWLKGKNCLRIFGIIFEANLENYYYYLELFIFIFIIFYPLLFYFLYMHYKMQLSNYHEFFPESTIANIFNLLKKYIYIYLP